MNDTDLLTKIGYLFLKNLGCYAISTEVKVYVWQGLRDYSNVQDRHYTIDLLGLQLQYLPPSEQYKEEVTQGELTYETTVNKKPILRGIEVKISRSDFKNGFIHCGCNYNYLLFPEGLIDKKEVNSEIGLVEVDLENFFIHKHNPPFSGFSLHGINVARKPKKREIPKRAIDYAWGQINRTLTLQVTRWVRDELLQSSNNSKTEVEK